MKLSQIEFLKLIGFINDLAHDSANGFEEISNWNKMECNKVLYDPTRVVKASVLTNPVMVPDSFGMSEPKDADTLFDGVHFGVADMSTGKAVVVTIYDEEVGKSEEILVKDGRWWFTT